VPVMGNAEPNAHTILSEAVESICRHRGTPGREVRCRSGVAWATPLLHV
jgi:hypothetical protein